MNEAVARPLTWMVQGRGLFAGSSRPLQSVSANCPSPSEVGDMNCTRTRVVCELNKVADCSWTWTVQVRGLNQAFDCPRPRLARGHYVFVDCPRTWTDRGRGQSEAIACTRPD